MLKIIILITFLLSNLVSSIYYIDNNKKLNNILKILIDKKNSEDTFIIKNFDKNFTINNNIDYQNIKLNILNTNGHLIKQTNLYLFMKNNQWSPVETLKIFENKLIDNKKLKINHSLPIISSIKKKKNIDIKKEKITNKTRKNNINYQISNLVKKIMTNNKNYIIKNKKNKIKINNSIKKMKKINKMNIINPFKQKSINLYKFNNKNYTKKELLLLMKLNKIKITDKNIINLSLTLRSINHLKFDFLYNYYLKINKKITSKAKIYILNTLLLLNKNMAVEKYLGKILLKNQRTLNKKEVQISYKLLNIF